MKAVPVKYWFGDDGIFPNNMLPVALYKRAMNIPMSDFLVYLYFKVIFNEHGWINNRRSGIFNFHHYHSNVHKVIGVCNGSASLLFGGNNGERIGLEKGDVIVIPAGVAHKNLGKENCIDCISAFYEGCAYDLNYGRPGERPTADVNIASLPIPDTDPLYGKAAGIVTLWQMDLFDTLTRL